MKGISKGKGTDETPHLIAKRIRKNTNIDGLLPKGTQCITGEKSLKSTIPGIPKSDQIQLISAKILVFDYHWQIEANQLVQH